MDTTRFNLYRYRKLTTAVFGNMMPIISHQRNLSTPNFKKYYQADPGVSHAALENMVGKIAGN